MDAAASKANVVVEDNAMDVFMSGPFLQWVSRSIVFVTILYDLDPAIPFLSGEL